MVCRSALLLLVLILWGCGVSPEDRVIGVWTAVPEESSVPPIPVPDLERQVNRYMAGISIKVRSDHSFVLAAAQPVEGKWELKGDELTFTPTKGAIAGPMRELLKVMVAKLNDRRDRLTLTQKTPIGDVLIVLRKTG